MRTTRASRREKRVKQQQQIVSILRMVETKHYLPTYLPPSSSSLAHTETGVAAQTNKRKKYLSIYLSIYIYIYIYIYYIIVLEPPSLRFPTTDTPSLNTYPVLLLFLLSMNTITRIIDFILSKQIAASSDSNNARIHLAKEQQQLSISYRDGTTALWGCWRPDSPISVRTRIIFFSLSLWLCCVLGGLSRRHTDGRPVYRRSNRNQTSRTDASGDQNIVGKHCIHTPPSLVYILLISFALLLTYRVEGMAGLTPPAATPPPVTPNPAAVADWGEDLVAAHRRRLEAFANILAPRLGPTPTSSAAVHATAEASASLPLAEGGVDAQPPREARDAVGGQAALRHGALPPPGLHHPPRRCLFSPSGAGAGAAAGRRRSCTSQRPAPLSTPRSRASSSRRSRSSSALVVGQPRSASVRSVAPPPTQSELDSVVRRLPLSHSRSASASTASAPDEAEEGGRDVFRRSPQTELALTLAPRTRPVVHHSAFDAVSHAERMYVKSQLWAERRECRVLLRQLAAEREEAAACTFHPAIHVRPLRKTWSGNNDENSVWAGRPPPSTRPQQGRSRTPQPTTATAVRPSRPPLTQPVGMQFRGRSAEPIPSLRRPVRPPCIRVRGRMLFPVRLPSLISSLSVFSIAAGGAVPCGTKRFSDTHALLTGDSSVCCLLSTTTTWEVWPAPSPAATVEAPTSLGVGASSWNLQPTEDREREVSEGNQAVHSPLKLQYNLILASNKLFDHSKMHIPSRVLALLLLLLLLQPLKACRAASPKVQAVYLINTSFIQNATAYGDTPNFDPNGRGLVSFWMGVCDKYAPAPPSSLANLIVEAVMAGWCEDGAGYTLQVPIFWSTSTPPGVYNFSFWDGMSAPELFLRCSIAQNVPGDSPALENPTPLLVTYWPGSTLLTWGVPWSTTQYPDNNPQDVGYRTFAALRSGLPSNFFTSGYLGGLSAAAPCNGARFSTFVLQLYQSPPLLLQMDMLPVARIGMEALAGSHQRQCSQTEGCVSRTAQCLIRLTTPEYTGLYNMHNEDWVHDGSFFFQMQVSMCNQSLSGTVSSYTAQLLREGFNGIIATAPRYYLSLGMPSELIQAVLSWMSSSRGNWQNSLWESNTCYSEILDQKLMPFFGAVTICNLSAQTAGILPTLQVRIGSQQLLNAEYFVGENLPEDVPRYVTADGPAECVIGIDLNLLVDPETFQLRLHSTGSIDTYVRSRGPWPREPLIVIGAGLLPGATIATSRNIDGVNLSNLKETFLSATELYGLPVMLLSAPYPFLKTSELADSTSLICVQPNECSSREMYIRSINRCAETWCIGSLSVAYYPGTLQCRRSVVWIVVSLVMLAAVLVAEIALGIIRGVVHREVFGSLGAANTMRPPLASRRNQPYERAVRQGGGPYRLAAPVHGSRPPDRPFSSDEGLELRECTDNMLWNGCCASIRQLLYSFRALSSCCWYHVTPSYSLVTHMAEDASESCSRSSEAGDRFLAASPCGPHCRFGCRGAAQGSSRAGPRATPPRLLAVAPYRFTFRAPVKGRWLDEPLLAVFVREFAYLPPALVLSHSRGGTTAAPDVEGGTLDLRRTLPAYVAELCSGAIRLEGRAEECRAAGEAYARALERWAAVGGGEDGCSWDDTVARLHGLPSSDAAQPVLAQLLQLPGGCSPPPLSASGQRRWATACQNLNLLRLRQRDVVLHDVWRQEGRIFAPQLAPVAAAPRTTDPRRGVGLTGGSVPGLVDGGAPPADCDHLLQILGITLAEPRSSSSGALPALLVVNKPSGMPVHPSGRYRKNAVTSILEDVLGGADRDRYVPVEHYLPPADPMEAPRWRGLGYVSVCHKTAGFELFRIWVRREDQVAGWSGIPLGLWREWRERMLQPSVERSPAGSNFPSPSCRASTKTEPLVRLFVVHRLDAATSGVLLFGLDAASARQAAELITQKEGETGCQKLYLARVQGRCDPVAIARTHHHCYVVDEAGGAGAATSSNLLLCIERPIGCLSFQQALYWCPGAADTEAFLAAQEAKKGEETAAATERCLSSVPLGSTAAEKAGRVAQKRERMREMTRGAQGSAKRQRQRQQEPGPGPGKPSTEQSVKDRCQTFLWETVRDAKTVVQPICYDPVANETTVLCRLFTGRTHQIRVHLGSVGHPIVGDDKYSRRAAEQQGERRRQHSTKTDPSCAEDSHNTMRATSTEELQGGKGGSAAPAISDDTDVYSFYQSEAARGAATDSDALQTCMCPDSIELHAWRYTLSFGQQGQMNPITFEAPPPSNFLGTTGFVWPLKGGQVRVNDSRCGLCPLSTTRTLVYKTKQKKKVKNNNNNTTTFDDCEPHLIRRIRNEVPLPLIIPRFFSTSFS
eukprot:gene984-579_t